jgi:hypothetical protein
MRWQLAGSGERRHLETNPDLLERLVLVRNNHYLHQDPEAQAASDDPAHLSAGG